jgi:serine/threonine-protein kinase RsbT
MIEVHYTIVKEDYANAGVVSSQIKSLLKELDISATVLRRIAISCYEAEINMIIHSDGGDIYFTLDDVDCSIQFMDKGPGIKDIEQAMTPGYSTAQEKAREFGFGAGMGLPNIKKNSDHFSLSSTPQGTHLTIGFKVK